MNPEKFLETAARLRDGAEESDYRACISRAYYAVYNMVRIAILLHVPLALRQASGLGDKSRIPHDRLAMRLKQSSDPMVQTIGENLGDLLSARHLADYNLEKPVSQQFAANEYGNADDLRACVNSYGVQKLALLVKADLERIHKTAP